ncbi:MAG: hypothetical protein QOF82_303 [Frankiales bacterium]|jgi:anti-sigma regulatory factor (Ser/Thr protein kinase)|nr:hypothetical protein [Frankiales bacterium]
MVRGREGNQTVVTLQKSATLLANLSAPATGRRLVRDACQAAQVSAEGCAMAELLTSELVTNAVIHGRSDVRLTVTITAGLVRVEVGDDSARLPVARPEDPEALSGRGVTLLQKCSTNWGTSEDHYGKTVWFELEPTQPIIPSDL